MGAEGEGYGKVFGKGTWNLQEGRPSWMGRSEVARLFRQRAVVCGSGWLLKPRQQPVVWKPAQDTKGGRNRNMEAGKTERRAARARGSGEQQLRLQKQQVHIWAQQSVLPCEMWEVTLKSQL